MPEFLKICFKYLLLFILSLSVGLSFRIRACAQTNTDTGNHYYPAKNDISIRKDTTIDTGKAQIGKVSKDSLTKSTIYKSAKVTDDSSKVVVSDSIERRPQPYQPVPKKAGLYSAILPGLGQMYNHQAWKVPIIYTAFGVASYFFITDLNNYQTYRKEYIASINNPNPTGPYSTSQLLQLENDYEKYLDMTVLYSVLGFGMQIIDAVASAHLKNFDVSRDISIKYSPILAPNFYGFAVCVNYR